MADIETSNFVHDALLFVTVLDESSFTKAADKLNLSKSVISKRIRRLETDLQLQLLHRSTRSLSPTAAGKILYERFSAIRQEIYKVKNHISHDQQTPTGIIRLHSPVSFGTKYLVPLIKAFTEQYPQIEIKLFLGKRFQDVIESRMDISIHIGPLKDSNLYVKKLLASPLVVCASPDYLEEVGYPSSPDDLLSMNCLRYHAPSAGNDWAFKVDGEYKLIQVSGNFSASNANTLEAAAIAGQGIVLLPTYVVKNELKSGRLVRVLDEYCSSSVEISALYSEREYLDPKVKLFLSFVEATLES